MTTPIYIPIIAGDISTFCAHNLMPSNELNGNAAVSAADREVFDERVEFSGERVFKIGKPIDQKFICHPIVYTNSIDIALSKH